MNPRTTRKRPVRLSAGQLPAELPGSSKARKRTENLRQIREMIRIAGERGSDLILFGEYANLDHRSRSVSRAEYVADSIPGTLVDAVAFEAKQAGVNVALPVLGTWKDVTSSFVVFIDRKGRVLDCYQKTHPTVAEQRLGIVPGPDLKTVKLDFGQVGTMTCMDIEYPEVAQVLMLRGAELLLFPHVQAGWGEVDWEIRYRARAVDTGLPVLSACFGYDEGEWSPGKMLGRSGVIGRDGGIVGDLGRGIGVVTCDLDLGSGRVTEFFFPRKLDRTLAVKGSRRPELYAELSVMGSKNEALRRIKGMGQRKNNRKEKNDG